MARQKCEVPCGPGSGFEEIDASAFVSPLISPAQTPRFLLLGNRPLPAPRVVAGRSAARFRTTRPSFLRPKRNKNR